MCGRVGIETAYAYDEIRARTYRFEFRCYCTAVGTYINKTENTSKSKCKQINSKRGAD